MRCAIYARVSSELQDTENSIARQLAACRAWASAHAGAIAHEHIYTDEAISGAVMLARAGLQRLLRDLAAPGRPPWDAVLVDDASRLDRGGHLAELVRLFAARGVQLVAVDRGRDLTDEHERLLVHVEAGMAEHYLAELGRRARAGMASKVVRGWHVTGPVYGYRLTPVWPEGIPAEQRSRDNRDGTRVEVDAEQAAIVQSLFERAAQGAGTKELAHSLNNRGIPSPRGGTWDATAIRSMLRNPKYRGDWTWNKSRWRKVPESMLTDEQRARVLLTSRHPRQRMERPAAEQVAVTREELRLVSDDLWEAVQARFQERDGKPNRRPTKGVLSGLLVCACGGSITLSGVVTNGVGYRYLECSWHRNRGPAVCQNDRRFREDRILWEIADYLKREILDPGRLQRLAAAVTRRLQEEAKRAAKSKAVVVARVRVQELRRRQKNLLRAIEEGGADGAVLGRRYAELERELATAQGDLARLERPPGRFEPVTEEELRERVGRLHEQLAGGGDVQRAALRALITQITVSALDGDWGSGWLLDVETRPWTVGLSGASLGLGDSGGALYSIPTERGAIRVRR